MKLTKKFSKRENYLQSFATWIQNSFHIYGLAQLVVKQSETKLVMVILLVALFDLSESL